jgi:uncharacterized membrane protein
MLPMNTRPASPRSIQNLTQHDLLSLAAGSVLLLTGLQRRSWAGVAVAAAGVPMLFRGITGRWPEPLSSFVVANDTRQALGGERGVHIRESIRLERPIEDVFAYWRRLENLPRVMSHLESVSERPDGGTHWVARGPGGMRFTWDAAIINEIRDQVIGWQSLPGSTIQTAGSVNFDRVRAGRSTQLTVHLQYSAPGGVAASSVAALFGQSPAQTVREDLRRFKQQMEAGEVATGISAALEASR